MDQGSPGGTVHFLSQISAGYPGFRKGRLKNWLVVATHIFFIFIPNFGEDSHFDEYFSNGLKAPTRESLKLLTTCFLDTWIYYYIFAIKKLI